MDACPADLELPGNLSGSHAAFKQRQHFISLGARRWSAAFVFARSLGPTSTARAVCVTRLLGASPLRLPDAPLMELAWSQSYSAASSAG
jgi:hypothetical protein